MLNSCVQLNKLNRSVLGCRIADHCFGWYVLTACISDAHGACSRPPNSTQGFIQVGFAGLTLCTHAVATSMKRKNGKC